jgi:copper chaperone CopZ
MKTIRLNVTGMSCEGCADSVRSALSQVGGVHNADVSLDQKTAVLEVEDTVQAADLVGAVEAAGYQATVAD